MYMITRLFCKRIACVALVVAISIGLSAQTFNANGVIMDKALNEPLIGVSVLEQGTQNGTISDMDGHFELSVAEGAKLVFSYIGFKEQTLSAAMNMKVMMGEDNEVLDEVIVTGYTTQRKADLTGAVAVMDMSKPTSEGSANAISSMQGRLPGVQVTSDAAPGAGGSSIRIRGMGTMNACDPLYIIDGVPSTENLNSLNPADIASIQVLKDAASASIYGSRAANGVIIITTKNAPKDRLSVNISYGATLQTIVRTYDMLSADEWGQVYWNAYQNAGLTPSHPLYDEIEGRPVLKQYLDSAGKVLGSNTDWQKQIYRPAWTHNVNASVASSTEKCNVYFSGNYMRQEGLIKETFYQRFSGRLNSDFKIGKWVKVGENLMVAQWTDRGYGTNADNGISFTAMRQHPAIPVYDADGNFTSPLNLAASDIANPVQQIANGKDNTNTSWRIFGNAFLEINPWVKGLYLKTNIGIEHVQYNNQNLNRKINASDINSYSKNYGEGDTWTWTNTIAYNNQFGNHRVAALLGTEAISYKFNSVGGARQNYAFEDNHYMTLGAGDMTTATNGGDIQTWRLFSIFAKADYNYHDRYLLSATIRRDATSRLAKKNNSGIFPAFSAAWRFTAEQWFPENPYFTNGKVRVSWGQNGNAAISNNYAAYSTYVYAGNAYYNLNATDTTSVAGIALASTGNEDLKWETTSQTNVGIDLGLFNNAWTISLDWYWKQTKDMITAPPVLSTAGEGAAYLANTGDMTNTGIELTTEYHSPDYQGFSWNGSFNLGYYRNKVVKLNDRVTSIGGDVRLIEGEPMGVYYGYVADGLFTNDEQVANHALQQGKGLGRIRYRDINGDGEITDQDQCIIGNPNPDLSMGLNLDFKYKGITLSMFFTAELGFDIINHTKSQLLFASYGGNSTNRGKDILNAWTVNNPTSDIPAISATDDNNETRFSTFFVEDGSYMKMKYLRLGYDFPAKITKAIHAQSLNIYFQAENIFTVTRYSGLDPELPLGTYGSRYDSAPYPRSRNFTFGLNLTF